MKQSQTGQRWGEEREGRDGESIIAKTGIIQRWKDWADGSSNKTVAEP